MLEKEEEDSYSCKNLLLNCTALARLDGCKCSALLKTGIYV